MRLILIVLLLGNRAALHQIVPARGGYLGDGLVGLALFESRVGARQVRLRLLHRGLRLPHLLIQIRRLHFGQQLAGGNAVADIHIAALDVAFGARQNRRFRHGLNIAGQHQVAHRGCLLRRNHGDIGQRVILHAGFGDDLQIAPMMRDVAHEERRQKDRGHQHQQHRDLAAGRPLGMLQRRVRCVRILLLQLPRQPLDFGAQFLLRDRAEHASIGLSGSSMSMMSSLHFDQCTLINTISEYRIPAALRALPLRSACRDRPAEACAGSCKRSAR